MVHSSDTAPSLGEAATQYLAKLSTEKREASQPEVYKFARWYGWERPFEQLAPPHVAGYAEQLSVSDIDYSRKLELVRAFLSFAKKAGWSRTNLATHLKTKRPKNAPVAAGRVMTEAANLTQQRYDELKLELENLKQRSRDLIVEIQRAAADKDFRENAPLQAAREERGYVEGRIKELDETLKNANIIEDKKESAIKASVGDSVVLCDLASEEEMRYKIVDPREVDPSRGKISMASPIGKALIGRKDGDIVEITAPAGKLKYQIKGIER
jgi:transcription elongation factor GreA